MQLIFSKDKAKIYIFFRKAINMIFYFPKKEKKVFIVYSFCFLIRYFGLYDKSVLILASFSLM